MALSTERLTPQVEQLVSTWLGIVIRTDKNPIDSYVEMMQSHPVLAAAMDLRIMLGVSMMDGYTHEDPEIQQQVRSQIKGMKGSFSNEIASCLTYLPFGYSFSEVVYKVKKRVAILDEVQLVDPRKYRFEGGMGVIKWAKYNGRKTIYLDYESGVHLINQPYFALGGDPYGVALCKRAYPYWELFKVVMVAMSIASQRQATPTIVGKTNTADSTFILDSNGNPYIDPITGQAIAINRGESMRRALREVENSSTLVIDLADEIIAIAQQTDGQFFMNLLHFLEGMMLLCFLVPRTVTGTGASSSGDSNLNEGHRETLRLVTKAQMEVVGESLVEQAIKPMLMFNNGDLDDYGQFPIKEEDNTDTIKLLDVMSNAIARGAFSAADIQVVNRMRELAGVDSIADIDFVPASLPAETGDRSFFLEE
jgi:hypothetical protein